MSSPPENGAADPAAPTPRVLRRALGKQVLLGLVIFLSGGVVGSGVTAHFLPPRLKKSWRGPGPGQFPRSMGERMKHDLGLSKEQAKKIEDIIRARMTAVRSIHEEYKPRLDVEIDQMRKAIDDVLTPEQRKAWAERVKRLNDERRRRWSQGGKGLDGRPGKPGGGPPGRFGQEQRERHEGQRPQWRGKSGKPPFRRDREPPEEGQSRRPPASEGEKSGSAGTSSMSPPQ